MVVGKPVEEDWEEGRLPRGSNTGSLRRHVWRRPAAGDGSNMETRQGSGGLILSRLTRARFTR